MTGLQVVQFCGCIALHVRLNGGDIDIWGVISTSSATRFPGSTYGLSFR
jgi:hypothetical protein